MCHLGIRTAPALYRWELLRRIAVAQAVPPAQAVRAALTDAAVELVRGAARMHLVAKLPDVGAATREAVLDRLLGSLAGMRGELLDLVVLAMERCTRAEYARAFGNPIAVMRTAEAFGELRESARALTAAAIGAARARAATGFAHPRPKTVSGAVRLARAALTALNR